MKKLGSLLGDKEGIARRKQLFIAAMNNMEKAWIRKDHTSEKHRLKLYRTLVKPVLLYNSATWGLTKKAPQILTRLFYVGDKIEYNLVYLCNNS